MAYEGYNGQVAIDGQVLVVTRNGIVARAAFGKDIPPRRIPQEAVRGVRLKEASWLGNGWIQLILGGMDKPVATAGTAASDPNVVLFTHGQKLAFGHLHQWLLTVVEYNQLREIDTAGVEFDAGQSRQLPSAAAEQERAEQKRVKQVEHERGERERAEQKRVKQVEHERGERERAEQKRVKQVEHERGERERADRIEHDPRLLHGEKEFAAELKATTDVTATLAKSIKMLLSRTKALREQLNASTKPRKLAAVGMFTRVVLYETELKLPRHKVRLTPDVHATAGHQGNKQVVQGWVVRSTNDRREMMLQVEWPGGYEVMCWERNDKKLTGSLVTPEEIYSMAAAINMAAANSSAAHQAMRNRQFDASLAMKQHLLATDRQVREHLMSADERLAALETLTDERQRHVGGTDKRFTKRLDNEIKSMAKAHAALTNAADRGRTFLEANQQDTGSAETDLARRLILDQLGRLMRSHLERQEGELSRGATAQNTPQSSWALAPEDSIAVLEQLGRLRDIGILTQQEFEAKKAEILGRL
jgi:hypothetical protein